MSKNYEPTDTLSLEGCKKIDRDYYNAKNSLAYLLNQEVLHNVAKLQLYRVPKKEEVLIEQLRLFQIVQTTYCYCEFTLRQSRTFKDPLFTDSGKCLISESLNIFLVSISANDSFGTVTLHRYLLSFLLQTSEFFQLFPGVPSHWMSLDRQNASLRNEGVWPSSYIEEKLFPLFEAIQRVSFAPTSHQFPDEFGIFYDCFQNIIRCANSSIQVKDWVKRSGKLVRFIVRPLEDISVAMLVQAPKFEPILYKHQFPLLQMMDGTPIGDIDVNIKVLFQHIREEETTAINPSFLFNVRLLERWLGKILKLMIDCQARDIKNNIFKEIRRNIMDLINAFFIRKDITCSICYYTVYLLSEFVKVFSVQREMLQEELLVPLLNETSLENMFLHCLNRDPNKDMIEDINHWNKFTNNQVFIFKLVYQFFRFGLDQTLAVLFLKERSQSCKEVCHLQLDSAKESGTLRSMCYAMTGSKSRVVNTDQVARQIVQNLISQNLTANNPRENDTKKYHYLELDPCKSLSFHLLATQASYFYNDPITCLFCSGLVILLNRLVEFFDPGWAIPPIKEVTTKNGLENTVGIMSIIIVENYNCTQLYKDIIFKKGGSCKYIKPSDFIQNSLLQSNNKILEQTQDCLIEFIESNEVVNISALRQNMQSFETLVISLYCVEKVKFIRTHNHN
ncbi:BA75_04876T0 [Komagataella pastoris]|uniref:BA75_04876T0 n=1 Tax=Komagataella pastoris TaxID=4922 RepID=A0A1B2JIP7_PICPA|nr:BA75_04876T0 [Komagataella pastoris]